MTLVETAVHNIGGRVSQVLMVPWRGQKDLPEADALLWHAWAAYKGSLCPCGCGRSVKVAHDPAAMGAVEVDDSTRCAFRAALDEWQAEQKPDDRVPGVLPVPVLDEKAYRIAKARLAAGLHSETADQPDE